MTIRTLILSGLALAAFAAPVQAYMDPGTGSMILQVILGGFAALGVMLKLYWHRFKAMFRRGSDPATANEGATSTEGERP